MATVVLGIGNALMSDEGVGVHAVAALEERYRMADDVEIVDGGTTGMELLPLLMDARHLIVIDAVRGGQPPGTVICLRDEQLPAFFRTKLSPHQIGLSDLLAALALTGGRPETMALIGVQPQSLELAMELSPPVAAQLDRVLALVVAELDSLGQSPTLRRAA